MGKPGEDLLEVLLTEEEMKELPDYYKSWPAKLLVKAINNMTKLRDMNRILCEIKGIELDWDKNYTKATEQLKVLREELELCKIEYTKPSYEELYYSISVTTSLMCGKEDNLEEFIQIFGWDLSDYEHCKDQGNSLEGFAISFLRFG